MGKSPMSKDSLLYIDFHRRHLYCALIFFWLLGSLSGALGRCVVRAHIPWASAFSSGSRLVCFVPILDVLLSAALFWGLPSWALLGFAFVRSAAFTWVAVGLRQCFGSAGWLLWPILLFSEFFFFPFLFLFWLRLLSEQWGRLDLFLCLTVAAMVSLTDYWLVMPFAAFLIDSK